MRSIGLVHRRQVVFLEKISLCDFLHLFEFINPGDTFAQGENILIFRYQESGGAL